jgi:hypothetical protein
MARMGLLIGLGAAALLATPLLGHGGSGSADTPAGGLEGPVAAAGGRPAGTLVFVFRSSRFAAIDVASGRRTLRRVPSMAACGPELQVTGGHVVFAGVRGDRTVVFSAPVSLDRPPRRLGSAHAFVASATEGRVWLAGVDCGRRAMVGVREVTVDGRVTRASRRRVPGTWLAGAVEGGLVLQRERALAVWDPQTEGNGRRLPLVAIGDTHGSKLVGCAPRSRCRDLRIVAAGAAREVPVRPTPPYRLDLGAEFSPDGSLLAAPAVADRRWSVALVDTQDGTSMIIPGSQTGRTYPTPSWAASTGWLFFRAGGDRVMAYRPGAPRAVALPFRLPGRALAVRAG